jgi:hypothetical protein
MSKRTATTPLAGRDKEKKDDQASPDSDERPIETLAERLPGLYVSEPSSRKNSESRSYSDAAKSRAEAYKRLSLPNHSM